MFALEACKDKPLKLDKFNCIKESIFSLSKTTNTLKSTSLNGKIFAIHRTNQN